MAGKDIFFASGDSPKMREAFRKAQDTFKYFWRELSWEYRRIIPALNVACVKVAFSQLKNGPGSELVVEHMWINEVNFDGNHVQGILVNSPTELTNISNGDQVEIPLSQISDWLFAITESKPQKGLVKLFSAPSKSRVYGAFTIQAMRSEMTTRERTAHDKAWGLDFGDYNEIFVVTEQREKPENLIEHPMSKNTKEKLIAFLKENPREINHQDENGYTLLHRETIAGNGTSVAALLAAGADKNIKTNKGTTALDFAEKFNWTHIIPVLAQQNDR